MFWLVYSVDEKKKKINAGFVSLWLLIDEFSRS